MLLRPLGYNKVIPSPTCPKRSSFLNARTNNMSMISLSIRWTWWDRERTAGLERASLGSRELCFLPGAWVAGNSWFSSWFIPNMNQAVGILRLCLCKALHRAYNFLERVTEKPRGEQAWVRARAWHQLWAGPHRMFFPWLLKELSSSGSIINAGKAKSWHNNMTHR